ncbi:MAG: hypothetical protein H6R19_345 [Proteobacteria bacterium]|nr:hypothetical protein [Pseudomonadota bacterium]
MAVAVSSLAEQDLTDRLARIAVAFAAILAQATFVLAGFAVILAQCLAFGGNASHVTFAPFLTQVTAVIPGFDAVAMNLALVLTDFALIKANFVTSGRCYIGGWSGLGQSSGSAEDKNAAGKQGSNTHDDSV